MFGVFRLRSGRDSPTTYSSSVLLPLPPTIFAFATYDAPEERRKRFLFLLTSPPQIFHLDLIPVLSLEDTIGSRDFLESFPAYQ